MARRNNDPVYSRVMVEQEQGHETRVKIIDKIEKELQRPVLGYFTSFTYPVMIEDSDADMIEGILQRMDLSNGLAIVINSPGGNGLAAERIINICRSYSGTNDFWVIVPGKAKSAATMVCFGASKIYMGATSELGPVDPQIAIRDTSIIRFSIFNIVSSYEALFQKTVKEKGNLEPYLQQLAKYDEREIEEFRAALRLADDIAIRSLKSGMMGGESESAIRKKIKLFLTPESTKTHGRPIFSSEAKGCGLNIEDIDIKNELWGWVYELYIRSNNLVQTKCSKCIESKEHSYVVMPP